LTSQALTPFELSVLLYVSAFNQGGFR
jgi:hypothetical protein